MDTVALWIAGCVLFATLDAWRLWQRLRAGAVILDLGPRHRLPWIALAVAYTAVGIVSSFGYRPAPIWKSLFWLELGLGFLVQSFGRPQLRERGVFTDGSLVPWTTLKSWWWDVPTNTVFFNQRSTLPWLRTFSLRIADEELLSQVDAILLARLPAPLIAR
jgi:hypothetical protein